VDLNKIEQLVDLVSRSRIAELDLTQDRTRIRILKGSAPRAEVTISHPAAQASEAVHAARQATVPPSDIARVSEITVPAPMHGVFYRAAAPNEPPLVEVGATIEVGQKICIIEAMKTFIDVVAETSGVVLAILAENGDEIEAGQTLFRIGSAGPS
jgi:acetyl-CoA carboxylase biotin carboxyl carrier protein